MRKCAVLLHQVVAICSAAAAASVSAAGATTEAFVVSSIRQTSSAHPSVLRSASCFPAPPPPPQQQLVQLPRVTTTTAPLAAARQKPHNNFALETDPKQQQQQQQQQGIPNRFSRALSTVASVAAGLFLLTTTAVPLPATASSYGSLSDEQKMVAEAWRLVDNSFLDRTFNHQDWFQIRQDYVHNNNKKYRDADEAHDAIREMVATLGDKYTRYLSPSQYQSLVDSATGTLAGVGIEISVDKKSSSSSEQQQQQRVIASDVQDNSPAVKAGIQPGDVFLEVDGVKFDETSTPDDVAVRLRGPVNSKVGVVMERNGKKIDYILQRQPITITAVKSYMTSLPGSAGKVGVVRIKNFSGTTAQTVGAAVKELKAKGAAAYVLDLRGNPGGLLPGGVDTAALFLEQDAPVVFVVNKLGVVDAQATLGTGMDTTTPIAVLVDSSTASAAEVFTAALQENGRAVVAGEQTFGKGIVQTIRELSDKNGGIAITVARYETPKHHDINQQGVAVDVKTAVDCPKDDATACLKGATGIFQKP